MRLLLILFLIISSQIKAQDLQINNLHYRNYFQSDSTKLNSKIHTSIKPSMEYQKTTLNYQLSKVFNKKSILYPIVDIGVGIDSRTAAPIDLGIGLGLDYHSHKLTITGKVLPYFTQGGYVRDSVRRQLHIDMGTGRAISNNLFLQGELIAAYRANKFFTFMGGIGKNSFGEGYRSMLLSDNAAANPFLKLETSFWTIKYVNIYNVWNDFSVDPQNKASDITKLSAIHYLSWNITKDFNLSIFESVIWQARDSLTSRYLEPNYLNPFVMFRPVEFAQGSADNVLLGMNLSYKPNAETTIYGQLILDEFLLAEIRARNQWWANKFGTQIGIKTKHLFVPNLYGQVEFNLVRPFTYSHQQGPQSYGHANASVTHPVGANFYEVNSILSYKLKQHQFTVQFAYAMFGTDTSEVSFGQNVWQSYSNRAGNFEQTIGQGKQQNIFSANLFYEYPIKAIPNTFITTRYQARLQTSETFFTQSHLFQIGIRSRIWNRYDDF